MQRMTRRTKAIAIIGVLVLLIAVSLVTYLLWPGSQSRSDANQPGGSSTELVTQALDTRASVYTTQDAFTRYMKIVQDDETIKSEYVHSVPSVDWNEEALVGVKFDLPVFQTYRTVGIEEVAGAKTVVIDVLDRSSNCMASAQVNYEHVAFVRVDQADAGKPYPVMIRLTPNEADCS